MPARIDELTDAQRARFSEWVERWTEVGLCTEEADWERFERGIRACYRFTGLSDNIRIVQVQNPLVAVLAGPIAAYLLGRDSVASSVGDSVYSSVYSSVRDSVRDSVASSVGDSVAISVGSSVGSSVRSSVAISVGSSVGSSVYSSVRDSVLTSVFNSVRDSVLASVSESVGDRVLKNVSAGVYAGVGGSLLSVFHSVRDSVVGASVADSVLARVSKGVGASVDVSVYASVLASVSNSAASSVGGNVAEAIHGGVEKDWINYFGGQFWVNWQACTSFFREVCELELPGDLWPRDMAYSDAQSSACWWWPHRDFVIASNRPKRISRDERGRLHDYNRLAIEFRDGWGVASFHGVRVPEYYAVTPADRIDVNRVMSERNADVQTAVIAKVGFERLLSQIKHDVISVAPGGERLLSFHIHGRTVRGLHCRWEEGDGWHERVIPVWWTREQFGADCPDDINDAEQVRRWTVGWDSKVEIVAES